MQRLCQVTGDELVMQEYERRSPLQVEEASLDGELKRIQPGARRPATLPRNEEITHCGLTMTAPWRGRGDARTSRAGDCVVAFSRKDIYALKAQIEAQTKHRCAMVYGRLPPETRAQQARLFNEPNSGYDVLVASDAIGMGLNLCVAEAHEGACGGAGARTSHGQRKSRGGRGSRGMDAPATATFGG